MLTLLEQLEAAGAVLHYHGDFDWSGIGIANALLERFAMRPWRMKAQDLEASAGLAGKSLVGSPIDASWDSALCPALVRRGQALHEEQVLDILIEDLRVA